MPQAAHLDHNADAGLAATQAPAGAFSAALTAKRQLLSHARSPGA